MRRHRRSLTVVLGTLAVLLAGVPLSAAPATGADVPIPVRVYLNKAGSKTKFVSKGTFALPNPAADDPTAEGGEVTFSSGVASETISLPAVNWSALGNPAGSKGFTYADPSGATCKKILVRGTTIKVSARTRAGPCGAYPACDGGTCPDGYFCVDLGVGACGCYTF